MPKSDNQKLKLLYIRDYLERNSDEKHPVGAQELIDMLSRHGITCERKSIYSDIRALQDFGIDILNRRGRDGGYYIASRNFELPELKLLIDAVQSSRFLTEKKSRELIAKLCQQCRNFFLRHGSKHFLTEAEDLHEHGKLLLRCRTSDSLCDSSDRCVIGRLYIGTAAASCHQKKRCQQHPCD